MLLPPWTTLPRGDKRAGPEWPQNWVYPKIEWKAFQDVRIVSTRWSKCRPYRWKWYEMVLEIVNPLGTPWPKKLHWIFECLKWNLDAILEKETEFEFLRVTSLMRWIMHFRLEWRRESESAGFQLEWGGRGGGGWKLLHYSSSRAKKSGSTK